MNAGKNDDISFGTRRFLCKAETVPYIVSYILDIGFLVVMGK
jgi:hypothetical protein